MKTAVIPPAPDCRCGASPQLSSVNVLNRHSSASGRSCLAIRTVWSLQCGRQADFFLVSYPHCSGPGLFAVEIFPFLVGEGVLFSL